MSVARVPVSDRPNVPPAAATIGPQMATGSSGADATPTGKAAAASGLLAGCFIFRALDDDIRRELGARAHRRRYSAGEVIFSVGEPGHAMMAIISGTVRIALPTVSGREVVLADLPAGEVFGEVALLDGSDRSASATARDDCELLVLERSHVLPILRERADVCLKLLTLLCARLRRSDERMADIGFSDLPARLAKTLLRGTDAATGGRLNLSQSALADMVGSSRENVNRQLRDWRRRGIVETGIGWVAVTRPAELAADADIM